MRDALARAGIDNPAFEAQVLLAHVTGRDRAWLKAYPEHSLAPDTVADLVSMAERRARREPMAQVIGTREFWSLDFRVISDTLTPRPDTEAIVSGCLELAAEYGTPRMVLDLGTGTGCLLLSLLASWPEAVGLGIDRSPAAITVAEQNAGRLGIGARASFAVGDWFSAVSGRFDLVVSNPPYIPSDEIAGLEPEVARYEPRLALNGGPDGMACYRIILAALPRHLESGGHAVFEHGAGQGGDLEGLVQDHGLAVARVFHDLSGHRRGLALRL
ncbi:MAG: peptide chain release factor N(5)-glutamine methyltransferase [Rhodospirillales bacterium]|nr:peptide chain release factor N(5)-glutamine methyltransferase [Rhodospirillales bacterium]